MSWKVGNRIIEKVKFLQELDDQDLNKKGMKYNFRIFEEN